MVRGHPTNITRVTTSIHLAVLDDEADITMLLANYLAGHGFRVSQLHSGTALMDLMARDAPMLVLLDLGLPGEDGFAIARQLREHWRCGLVIVTGRGDAVDKVVGLEVGADDYVTKPSICANCWRASKRCCAALHLVNKAREKRTPKPRRRCCASRSGSSTPRHGACWIPTELRCP